MQLKEYLRKNLIDPRDFAKEAGISVTSLYRYLKGGFCHRKRAYLIEKLTKGIVTANELMGTDE